MNINGIIAEELKVKLWQVEAAVKLIDEGNTIPFIARYRKPVTGELNDEQLRDLDERLKYLRNLEEKKNTVIASIEEQGKMTPELLKKIEKAMTIVEVDDIYRPYRPKRKTRATEAKAKGLEPLAMIFMAQISSKTPQKEAQAFVNKEKGVETVDDAIQGAKDIIAESVSDNAEFRDAIRNTVMKHGEIVSVAKNPEEKTPYENYYDYVEGVNKIPGSADLQPLSRCATAPPRGASAAAAVSRHDPSRENSVWSAPQSATNAKFKIFFPLKMARAKRKPFKIVSAPQTAHLYPLLQKNCIFRKFVLDNRPTFRYNRARSRGKMPHELERSWPGSSVG